MFNDTSIMITKIKDYKLHEFIIILIYYYGIIGIIKSKSACPVRGFQAKISKKKYRRQNSEREKTKFTLLWKPKQQNIIYLCYLVKFIEILQTNKNMVT